MSLMLVTGATGFIGSHLLDALLARGYRVRCTVRRTSDRRWLAGRAHEPVETDLRDGSGLREAMEGIDTVFHVAGVLAAPTEEEYREGNVLASRRMVEAAIAARVRRFVDVSSLAVAGPGEVDEETPCRPISIYGRTKLEGEREVWRRRGEIGVTIIRPPVVYGERDQGLLEMYRLLKKGMRPDIGGTKYVSIVHVSDLVRGIVEAAEHPKAEGEIFFLSNERPCTYAELMAGVLDAMGRSAVRLHMPNGFALFLGRLSDAVMPLIGVRGMFSLDKAIEMTQSHWVCSPAKAKRVLGWEARIPVDRGLRETIEWCESEGWL